MARNALAVVALTLAAAGALAFEAVLPAPPGGGWEVFRLGGRRPTVYRAAEGGDGSLHARADGAASLLFLRVEADAAQWPILAWRWRVTAAPAGADLRRLATDDAAARVFVGFRYQPGMVPLGQRLAYRAFRARHGAYPPFSALAYVWATAPGAGAVLRHPDYPRLHQIVLHAGEGGEWREERRNLRLDYLAAFGAEPPPIAYIAVLTDADDTGGSAEAFYADFELLPAGASDGSVGR